MNLHILRLVQCLEPFILAHDHWKDKVLVTNSCLANLHNFCEKSASVVKGRNRRVDDIVFYGEEACHYIWLQFWTLHERELQRVVVPVLISILM